MLQKAVDSVTLDHAKRARRIIADGIGEVSAAWLKEGRVVMAEESGELIDAIDSPRLEKALKMFGVTKMLAISNDPLIIDDLVYELDCSTLDFDKLSITMTGINAIVVPRFDMRLAILGTVDGFRLVAGPREFITAYSGNIAQRRMEFVEYISGFPDSMQRTLNEALRYMDWVQ